jgi:hypothetical protein
MKQLIKEEPALDIRQQTSVVEVLVEEHDQARVTKEEVADLKADIAAKDSAILAKDALLQYKELQVSQLKAEVRRLQLNHPPPPPVPRSTCSVCDPRQLHHQHHQSRIIFFRSKATATAKGGRGAGGGLLHRPTACQSLPLSPRLLLQLRLLLMIIMKSSTLVTRTAKMMMTQLHGCAAVRVYLLAAAW